MRTVILYIFYIICVSRQTNYDDGVLTKRHQSAAAILVLETLTVFLTLKE